MNSSCSCVLPCNDRDESLPASTIEGDGDDKAVELGRNEFTPGPFGRWALFLANTSRARVEQAEEGTKWERLPIQEP